MHVHHQQQPGPGEPPRRRRGGCAAEDRTPKRCPGAHDRGDFARFVFEGRYQGCRNIREVLEVFAGPEGRQRPGVTAEYVSHWFKTDHPAAYAEYRLAQQRRQGANLAARRRATP